MPCCKYCRGVVPMNAADGSPCVFPDRESCRVIQIAEYERLPAEAMKDRFRPPSDELAVLCSCLHCPPDAPPFEAVEMRWLADVKKWACPETECGGLGFDFDIHPVAPRWKCAECGKKWSPPGGNYKPSNCKCPVCGCRNASGMFDDEHSEEEIEAMTDEEYAKAFGRTRAEEEAEYQRFTEEFERREKAEKEASPEAKTDDDNGDEDDEVDDGDMPF
ncbi:MAG: hypothetical protein NTW19_12165 [Planctomycetota bacterium]|nr:hypothetical protein [Planctomycetota bacterium]